MTHNKTSKDKYDYCIKLLLLGDCAVGKSSLLTRFMDGTYTDTFIGTIGIDFGLKTLRKNGKSIKLHVWDAAGHERFNSLASSYCNGAHGIFVVYDMTNQDSFDDVKSWIKLVDKHAPKNVTKILLGNKCDLRYNKAVDSQVAAEFAEEFGTRVFETSAKDGTNVEEALMHMVSEVMSHSCNGDVLSNNTQNTINLIDLPRVLKDFRKYFGNTEDLSKILSSHNSMDPVQKKVWKYSGNALSIGRSLNTVLFVMAGQSGSGKSKTINEIFGDPNLLRTNAYQSETKEPAVVSKTLCVQAETPFIRGKLAFMDVPGIFDTTIKDEVVNVVATKKFLNDLPELQSRKDVARNVPKSLFHIRTKVYPNAVLFVVKVPDNRLLGDNSFFTKSLKAFKETTNLLDKKRPNLIVVLTHVDGIPKRKFCEELDALKRIISDKVKEILGIRNVPIVPIENRAEDCGLEKVGDFYQLPNGELSHQNLWTVMMRIFEKNQDLLGNLLVSWYFESTCPDKTNQAEIFTQSLNSSMITEDDLIEIGKELRDLNVAVDSRIVVPEINFQSLGYGYCPVTEEVRPVRLIEANNLKEVEIENTKFRIPSSIQTYVRNSTRFRRLSFFEKDEYEKHMLASYGIEAGMQLVVHASSEGRWVQNSGGSGSSSLITLLQEVKLAKFQLENPKEKVKNEEFFRDLHALPETYDTSDSTPFRRFFSKWGTHLVYEQAVGGCIQVKCVLKSGKRTEQALQDIENQAKGLFHCVTTSGNVDFQRKVQGLRQAGVSDETLEIDGGTQPNLTDLMSLTANEWKEWSKSIIRKPAELKWSLKLYPYYNMVEGDSRYNSLREATKDYLIGTIENRNSGVESFRDEIAQNAQQRTVASSGVPACFPKGTLITLSDGRNIPIEDVGAVNPKSKFSTLSLSNTNKSGHMNVNTPPSSTKFCAYLDYKLNDQVEYLVLHFSNGKNLAVSPAHMIFQFVPGKISVIGKQAVHFKVGDMLIWKNAKKGADSYETPTITNISRKFMLGAFCPLMQSGTFLANGFFVSSYANVDSFGVAQMVMYPLKVWCRFQGSKRKENRNGIHPYAKCLQRFRSLLSTDYFIASSHFYSSRKVIGGEKV